MSRNLINISFLALASLSQAAPNVCPQASAIATALSKASISVTPFCSSFLGIPTRTSTVTLTSTPSPIIVDSTSTVLSLTTESTTITSTVTTATVTVTTATSYSIDGSNQKRALATGKHIPNPVESDGLNKRTAPKVTTSTSQKPTSTATIPACLTAFASNIISSGCACLNIPTPTQTTTVSTTLPASTITRTSTITVTATTTTTQQVDQTATATATSTAVVDVCNASNNYGFIYSGGYATLSPDQSGVSATSKVIPNASTQQACCAACYNTPSCYLYYLEQGCTLLLTQGGSSTQATAQCPQGQLQEFPASNDPASAYFGIGACARYAGLSS